jgi:peptide/nickel transport system substrate-binding protein
VADEGWDADEEKRSGLTRRQAIGGAVVGGVAVGGIGLAAGWWGGGSDAEESDGAATTSQQTKRGGSLRVALSGGSSADTVDVQHQLSPVDHAIGYQLYDSLASYDVDFKHELTLAESLEATGDAADVWDVRIREGVEFHNGKTVTADDVIFSLRRIVDPKNPGVGAQSLGTLDPQGMKKLDDRTVRITLKGPNAVFPEDVGQYFNAIYPTEYDIKKPVGTGPFKLKSFDPGRQVVFERNPNYWREGEPIVDELTLLGIQDDTARVNALVSGQVHAINSVPGVLIDQVKGNSSVKLLTRESGYVTPIYMRVDLAPFNDARVRLAFKLIADRKQLIDQALNGFGAIGNDILSPFDHCYEGAAPQREQDIEQAKSLLKQAGRSDLSVELVTAPVARGMVSAMEVFAEQAQAAGVRVRTRRVDSGTLYGDQYLKWPFMVELWTPYNYLQQAGLELLPGAPYNESHWSPKKFVDLCTEARRTLDDDKRCELVQEAMRLQHDDSGMVAWGFMNLIDAHSTSITGLQPSRYRELGNYGLRGVSFVS